MKFLSLYFIIFVNIFTSLFSHGFDADTLVCLANGIRQPIDVVCRRSAQENVYVTSFDTNSWKKTYQLIKQTGRNRTRCHIRLKLLQASYDEIVCTFTQEFYVMPARCWKSAYMLQTGDHLLCAHGDTAQVIRAELIDEPITVFTLTIENTHTFFVGRHFVLAHNMPEFILEFIQWAEPVVEFVAGSKVGQILEYFGPPGKIAATVVTVGAMYLIDRKSRSKSAQPVIQNNPTTSNQIVTTLPAGRQVVGFAHPSQEKNEQKVTGCGSTVPQQSLPPSVTPAQPIIEPKPTGCHKPIIVENKSTIGCKGIQIPEPKKQDTIGCKIKPVKPSKKISCYDHYDKYKKHHDKNNGKTNQQHDQPKERYDGPTYGNMHEIFEKEKIGKKLQENSARIKGEKYNGAQVYRIIKDIPELDLHEKDIFYLDTYHGDHIEAFKKNGDPRAVLSVDGRKLEDKLTRAKEQGRKYVPKK